MKTWSDDCAYPLAELHNKGCHTGFPSRPQTHAWNKQQGVETTLPFFKIILYPAPSLSLLVCCRSVWVCVFAVASPASAVCTHQWSNALRMAEESVPEGRSLKELSEEELWELINDNRHRISLGVRPCILLPYLRQVKVLTEVDEDEILSCHNLTNRCMRTSKLPD